MAQPGGRPQRSPRPATITDVAAAAGVAASTVSRSFTRPGRVNHRTREHVLAVAESLGYQPNPAAQALESGRTRTVGLLVPDITNPYFAGIIKGAERAAAAAGLTLMLGDTQENAAQEGAMVRANQMQAPPPATKSITRANAKAKAPAVTAKSRPATSGCNE